MSAAHETFALMFDRAAEAAKSAEMAYRKAAAAEIARFERERVVAFRRARLVKLIEGAGSDTEASGAHLRRQAARICREFGWSGDKPGERAVIDRIEPVCAAIASRAEAADVARLLGEFEAWFEADRGVSFYSLFDTHVQETPVVDF